MRPGKVGTPARWLTLELNFELEVNGAAADHAGARTTGTSLRRRRL